MTPTSPRARPGVVRNSVFVVFARLADIAGSAVLLVLAARYFGVDTFGVYAYIQGIALFLTPVLDWGVQRILIRDLAVDKDDAGPALSAGLTINLLVIAAVGCCLAAVQTTYGLVDPQHIPALVLAVAAQATLCLTRCLSSVFIAFECMIYETAMSLVARSLVVLFCVGVVLAGGGITAFFGGIFGASAISLFMAAYLASTRFVRPGPWAGWKRVRLLLHDASALALSAFLNQGYGDIYIFPLKYLRSPLDVSYFQAAKRMVDAATVVTRAMIIAMSPGISRLGGAAEATKSLGRQLVDSTRYAMLLLTPAALIATLLGTDLAILLFGPDFAPAGASLAVLVWTLPAFFINALMETSLTALHRPRTLVVTHGVGFIWAGLVGILAIKNAGFIGAAWTMLTAYWLVCLLNAALTARLIGLPGFIPALARPLLVCGTVFGIARLALAAFHPFIAVVAAMLLCLPALLALKVVRLAELEHLRSMLFYRPPVEAGPRDGRR